MSDRLKQIAILTALAIVGGIVGGIIHDHGGTFWWIPALAIGFPVILLVIILVMFVFFTDWSH